MPGPPRGTAQSAPAGRWPAVLAIGGVLLLVLEMLARLQWADRLAAAVHALGGGLLAGVALGAAVVVLPVAGAVPAAAALRAYPRGPRRTRWYPGLLACGLAVAAAVPGQGGGLGVAGSYGTTGYALGYFLVVALAALLVDPVRARLAGRS